MSFAGETVVAADGAQVVLALPDGREMTVQPRQVAKIDSEVSSTVMPDATDSAVANYGKDFQTLASALTGAGKLDDLLEAPAAGASVGTGGNECHSFVEFLQIIAEVVTPLSYQFGTDLGALVEAIQGAPLSLDAVAPAQTIAVTESSVAML